VIELPAVLRNPEDDAIKAGTLRATLGTQAVVIIGALLTGLKPLFGDSFSSGERTAIIIAAIALIAISTGADVIARSWVTAASSMTAAPLPKPMAVKVISPQEDYEGVAVELMLVGGDERYFVVPTNGAAQSAAWHKRAELKF
jgi:hypothetical protein